MKNMEKENRPLEPPPGGGGVLEEGLQAPRPPDPTPK